MTSSCGVSGNVSLATVCNLLSSQGTGHKHTTAHTNAACTIWSKWECTDAKANGRPGSQV